MNIKLIKATVSDAETMLKMQKEVMGKHVNNKTQNIIGWVTITILVGLSAFLVFSVIFSAFGGK